MSRGWLALRSLFWTLVFPGFFAGYLPWSFFGLRSVVVEGRSPLHWIGLFLICLGTALLGVCIFTLALIGKGTPAPFDPPRRLVIRGPYGFVRNPMYIGAGLALAGAAFFYESWPLLGYTGLFFLGMQLFVLYEEPTLRQTFGEPYETYCGRVGRWFPRFRSLKRPG
jgi:protein-S-isoprenylcysteine O-methyltransferase Ste14